MIKACESKLRHTFFAIMATASASCHMSETGSDIASVPKATKVKEEEAGGGDVKLGKFTLNFSAIGSITIKKRLFTPAINVVTQQVNTTLDGDTLTVEVSNVNTKNKNVNKEIQKKNGVRVYQLVTKAELTALKKTNPDYKKVASVVMFAKSVTSEGKTWEIKPPMPVYVLPTNDSDRYKNITDEGISFSGTLNNGIRDFTAEVKIRKLSEDEEKVLIEVNWNLPDDYNGTLYGQLPMGKFSTYEIDVKSSVVKRIWTNSIFSDNGTVQQSNFLYRICSYADELHGKNDKDFSADCSSPTAPGEVMGRPQ